MFCFVSSFLTFLFLFKDGWTPLHIAASNGFKEIVKIFIGHGANVNIQNEVFFFFFFWCSIFVYFFFIVDLLILLFARKGGEGGLLKE